MTLDELIRTLQKIKETGNAKGNEKVCLLVGEYDAYEADKVYMSMEGNLVIYTDTRLPDYDDEDTFDDERDI